MEYKYKNGARKPSAQEVKSFIDAQVSNMSHLPVDERLGSYAWAAQVTNASTRTVRRWCDPNNPVNVPYCDWVVMQMVAGNEVALKDPAK